MLLASARGRMVALRLLGAPQDSPLVLTTALIAGDQVILHILKKAGLLNREIKVICGLNPKPQTLAREIKFLGCRHEGVLTSVHGKVELRTADKLIVLCFPV